MIEDETEKTERSEEDMIGYRQFESSLYHR
jgi:hypothetical protein